jgi:feruloyl esterase
MSHRFLFLACGLAFLPCAATAQSAGNFSQAAQSPLRYTLAPAHPRLDCRAVASLGGGEVTITSTEEVPASEANPPFCRVKGVIAPEIQFEVDLPANWNRRFYMFGNGGYAGENLELPARRELSAAALRAGFLTAQQNTGHDASREPLGAFGSNLQKTMDYAFRAVHETAVEAKRLGTAYYGHDVTYSYWDACSTGGRQGLMSVQRFPEDFDGVIAGAPVRNFVDTMVNYVWNAQALDGAGLTLAKMKTVAEAAYGRCAGRDGLIEDPRKCDFSPARDVKTCPPGQDGEACLTPNEAKAIDQIYAGITLPEGGGMFFGWPKGAEVADGWGRWIIDPEGKLSRQTQYMLAFMRNLAFGHAEPDFDFHKFDFVKDPPRMSAIRSLLNADDTDLSAFRRRGGKLIMYHGWADTALTPFMSVDYYERAVAANGQDTPDFFRLYMIPGMAHCQGGIATDRFDGISSIVNWTGGGHRSRSHRGRAHA